MGIVIREADVEREGGLMLATLNATRQPQADQARFRWLYLENPDGRAVAWFAVDDRTGEIAGFTGVFPRRVWVAGGREEIAWNCGDFSIQRRYRTMGVAAKLRRAAREAVDHGVSRFLYAHPNDRMLPVHLKVGHRILGRMVRYVKVLKPRTGWPVADRPAAGLLRMAGLDWLERSGGDVELRSNGPLGEEFDELYRTVRGGLGTAVVRDAKYLEWRFCRHPLRRVEILVARRRGRLSGYVIFTQPGDGRAVVTDWLAVDTATWRRLFATFICEMRGRDASAVSVTLLETHPHIRQLRRFGFIRRPRFSVAVVYAPATYAGRSSVLSADSWYMTVGDRDV